MRLPYRFVALALPLARATARLAPRADPTAPWVTVDDAGQPVSTITPSVTAVDGVPTVSGGAPHDLTASVFTFTVLGEITVSTGSPPPPRATDPSGAGAFARCFNASGLVCDPPEGGELNPGNTYYVTWDPDSSFFDDVSATNGTLEVSVRGDFVNATDGSLSKAFESSDSVPAAWGFYPWAVSSSLLSEGRGGGANISLSLRASRAGSRERTTFAAARTVLVRRAAPPPPRTNRAPDKTALTIALPTIFGFVVLCLLVNIFCNRHARTISLGNVMSRTRHGRGLGGRLARTVGPGGGGRGIRLDDDVSLLRQGQGRFRDEDWDEGRGVGGASGSSRDALGEQARKHY